MKMKIAKLGINGITIGRTNNASPPVVYYYFVNNFVSQINIQSSNKPILRVSNTGIYNGNNFLDCVLRLNTDLTLDNTFDYPNFNSGNNAYNGGIRTLIQSDNKVISIAETNGTTQTNRRYNSDGSVDGTYTSGYISGTTNRTAIIKSDNKVLTIKEDATNANKVQLWNTNGTLDGTFSTTTTGVVINGAFDNLGGIYVRGTFTQFNGVNKNRIFKLLATGASDTTFNNGITLGTSGNIFTMGVQSTNKLVGGFTNYNNVTYNRLIRLNTNGSFDNTFTAPTSFQPTAILVLNNDKILCWGTFTSVGGNTNIKGICRLNADGTLDNTFNNDVSLDLPFFNNDVQALGTLNGTSDIYIACPVTVGLESRVYIYKLDSNGNFLI